MRRNYLSLHSGSSALRGVQVQILSSAPSLPTQLILKREFFPLISHGRILAVLLPFPFHPETFRLAPLLLPANKRNGQRFSFHLETDTEGKPFPAPDGKGSGLQGGRFKTGRREYSFLPSDQKTGWRVKTWDSGQGFRTHPRT